MPVHSTHLAAGADPLSVGDLRERGVKAVDVVGGGASVTAEQLSTILTYTAKLDVVIVFLLHSLISPVVIVLSLSLRQIIPGLPLDPLLLLVPESQTDGADGECMCVQGRRRGGWGWTAKEGMWNGTKKKKGEEVGGGGGSGTKRVEGVQCALDMCACLQVELEQRRNRE